MINDIGGALMCMFIGFLFGMLFIVLRAEHFCELQGFEEWGVKGCYNEVEPVYQNPVIE